MGKLTGYSKVAVIKYAEKEYCFAIYDDGNNYQVGDRVYVSGVSPVGTIEQIMTPEEHQKYFSDNQHSKNISAEIICKVDVAAYEKRVEQRKEKDRLRTALDKKKKELQKVLDDEYYASKDETYAELLKRYESL